MLTRFKKFLETIKFFQEKTKELESLSRQRNELQIKDDLEFKKDYERVRDINDKEVFKKLSISLIVKKISQTEYGKYKDFIFELKYLMHYLFLMLEDDHNYGDKIFQKTLTQIENYIYSAYRKKPLLYKNIKKISILGYSDRFSKIPKENILSYFVFLEENGVEIVEIMEDFCEILSSNEDAIEKFFNSYKGLKKTYDKKPSKDNNKEKQDFSHGQLKTVFSKFNDTSKLAKIKIYRDNLDKN